MSDKWVILKDEKSIGEKAIKNLNSKKPSKILSHKNCTAKYFRCESNNSLPTLLKNFQLNFLLLDMLGFADWTLVSLN